MILHFWIFKWIFCKVIFLKFWYSIMSSLVLSFLWYEIWPPIFVNGLQYVIIIIESAIVKCQHTPNLMTASPIWDNHLSINTPRAAMVETSWPSTISLQKKVIVGLVSLNRAYSKHLHTIRLILLVYQAGHYNHKSTTCTHAWKTSG